MQIVTLTTDLGHHDHYVASLKGQLLSKVPDIKIVDISHLVKPFNIAEASYYINNVIKDFPQGTIHFIAVDSIPVINIDTPKLNMYPIVMKLHGQFFVGLDNGFFSLLPNFHEAEEIIVIDNFSSKTALRFPNKNIYVPCIVALVNGKSLSEIGEPIKTVRRAFLTQATTEHNLIKGSVIHIDYYGNVIVNITETLFKQIGKGEAFTIYFRQSKYFIERISDNYNEVPIGEKLALFNENGFLEIAINKGIVGNGGGA
ncbi:MAG: SAM-dependent chlorinase/fluorinase, partial [Putridiphycobacter sp.]|nr:SAM-dependent chlorinase/fluorinase [Putridiphycobacter sp.]